MLRHIENIILKHEIMKMLSEIMCGKHNIQSRFRKELITCHHIPKYCKILIVLPKIIIVHMRIIFLETLLDNHVKNPSIIEMSIFKLCIKNSILHVNKEDNGL